MDALDVLSLPALSQEAIDIVFGTLLGDASLSFSRTSSLPNISTASFIYDLGLLHKDIVLLVAAVLSQYAVAAPRQYGHFDKRSGKTTTSFRFSTVRSPLFLPFVKMFYTVNNTGGIVKHLPANFATMLTPRALAF